jgi:hypothetical protein
MTITTLGSRYNRSHGLSPIWVISIAHHRNGVCGEPFYVVTFRDKECGTMVATLFPTYSEDDNGHETYSPNGRCAVLNIDKLTEGDIAFGSNSWRGDHYEDTLCRAITNYAR